MNFPFGPDWSVEERDQLRRACEDEVNWETLRPAYPNTHPLAIYAQLWSLILREQLAVARAPQYPARAIFEIAKQDAKNGLLIDSSTIQTMRTADAALHPYTLNDPRTDLTHLQDLPILRHTMAVFPDEPALGMLELLSRFVKEWLSRVHVGLTQSHAQMTPGDRKALHDALVAAVTNVDNHTVMLRYIVKPPNG